MTWIADGACGNHQARFDTDLGVSVGRTDAGQMGFVVYPQKTGSGLNPTWEGNETNFVLDRKQVAALIDLLVFKLPGLRRARGSKTDSVAVLRLINPTFRLNNELQFAAVKAHPGWRQIKDLDDPAEWQKDSEELPLGEEDDWTAEPGTPDGMKLIKWFFKTHPRKARRIERDFTRRLWKGQL